MTAPLPPTNLTSIDFDFEDLLAAAIVSVITKRPKKPNIYLQTPVVNSGPLSLNPC
jgi:hypothetical protein